MAQPKVLGAGRLFTRLCSRAVEILDRRPVTTPHPGPHPSLIVTAVDMLMADGITTTHQQHDDGKPSKHKLAPGLHALLYGREIRAGA